MCADSGAGVAERDEEALVEQTVSNPDAPDDQATIGVVSLTVEDQTMVLRLVVTPDFASVSDAEEIALGDVWDLGAIRFGVDLRLVDREKLKEYSVIADTSGVRWSSTGSPPPTRLPRRSRSGIRTGTRSRSSPPAPTVTRRW